MPFYITTYQGDPTGIPDGYPRTADQRPNGSPARPGETILSDQQYADLLAQHAAAMAAREIEIKASEPYVITDFFDRLTAQERSTIRTLAKDNDSIADLWENLLALHEGIECPPDGATPGRTKSQAAKGACAQIFGQPRADALFARP